MIRQISMVRFLERLMWITFSSGITIVFMNFSKAPTQAPVTNYPKPFIEPKPAAAAPPVVEEEQEQEEDEVAPQPRKRYVTIGGKWYEYRPDNTYMVNGVPTLYINGQHRDLPDPPAAPKPRKRLARAEDSLPASKIRRADRQPPAEPNVNPLKVYSPGGVKNILRDAQEARRKMELRNRELMRAYSAK
ncbi:MAG: hypothetical protein AB7F86_16555 [Bdellovibrionales bacterium]